MSAADNQKTHSKWFRHTKAYLETLCWCGQEQGKVAALSAELETPLNVHRWRKLEGTDPAVYEALLKIQASAVCRLS